MTFINQTGLSTNEARILLLLKMLSGCCFAFYFDRFSGNFDYLGNNVQGKIQYEILLTKPSLFFTDFSNDLNMYGFGGLLNSQNSFWGYLRFNLLYKLIAIFNLVTHGNFYLNSVVFCSFVYFGHIAFYRIFNDIYKGKKPTVILVTFCLPSLLLYTSCVHKDGIVFLCLGLTSFIFYRILINPRIVNLKNYLVLLLSLATIFLFRNYVIIAIVPAIILAWLFKIMPYRKRYILLMTYAVFFILFFLSGLSQSFINLPEAVVQRKADFESLGIANTNIPMKELYPTAKSFIANLPQAINHYFFRPYLWEFSQPSILLTALELFVYQVIFLLFILYRKKTNTPPHLFNVFGIALLFNMALIIGYTIPNIGAIVRYRSIFWVFIICPLVCNTDWSKFFSFRRPTLI